MHGPCSGSSAVVSGVDFTGGPRQFFFRCGLGKAPGWTPWSRESRKTVLRLKLPNLTTAFPIVLLADSFLHVNGMRRTSGQQKSLKQKMGGPAALS